jgi:outer membrane receptor protein involved in Fe transport
LTGQPIDNGRKTFNPDTLTTYEAGYKAELLNKTLAFEASLYRINWKDIQVFQSVNGFNTTVNAGRAEINGLELTSSYRPSNHWTWTASLSLADARMTEGVDGLADAGDRLPDTPRVSAALTADYRFDVAGHSARFGAAGRYVGDRNANFAGNLGSPNYALPAYSMLDIHGGIDFKRLAVGFYLKNVTDVRGQMSADTGLVGLGGNVLVSVVQPRTLGFTVTAPF